MPDAEFTLLNTMAGHDFETALDRHVEWGVRRLDLKDSIYGKGVAELTAAEAERARAAIERRGLSVYCISTVLFGDDIEMGRERFLERNLAPLAGVVDTVRILEPRLFRLIAAGTQERPRLADSISYVSREHPWLFDAYRQAIEIIGAAGLTPTIENESGTCILGRPAEFLGLFERIASAGPVTLTWDAVNLWRSGTFPAVSVYEQLKPLIGYFHVKGGRSEDGSQELRWKSSLAEATWPVQDVSNRVIEDGVSPVICINPPKGALRGTGPRPSSAAADLAFMRSLAMPKDAS